MRHNHSYISLIVDSALGRDDAKRWLETVEAISPRGTRASASIMVNGYGKSSDFYVLRDGKRMEYIVPLNRDLLEDEAGKIAIAWSRACSSGDFEICFSQAEQSRQRKKQEIALIVDEISERMAKLLHADWVRDKVSHHWNYGPKYSPVSKHHPMLMPWEQLATAHRESEISKVRRMFDIMDSINLRLAGK